MPKALSLKKPQKSNIPANQRAITQFFKNINPLASQKVQNSPSKCGSSQENHVENKPVKRKAGSPAVVDIVVIPDDQCVTEESNTPKTILNTPKKHKSDKVKLATRNSVIKRSPQKENGIANKSNCITQNGNHDEKTRSSINQEENVFDKKLDRLPLTPVKSNIETEQSCSNLSGEKSSPAKNNIRTPVKCLEFDKCEEVTPSKIKRTPKKSHLAVHHSPHKIKFTPEKVSNYAELSPSKSGSTVKLDLHGVDDMFGDEWEIGDMDETCTEDLDLSVMQRCEVLSVQRHPTRIELRLKSNNKSGTCFVEGFWLDTQLTAGETISVLASRDSSGQYSVTNTSGLLVLRPDHLISSTSVVAGVFCKRKAVLQERWKGIDGGNTAMTIGILVHELVQKALTHNMKDVLKLRIEADRIIKESIQMLYDAGLTEEETRNNVDAYIGPLSDFMQTYMGERPSFMKPQKNQWTGQIDKVLDIEENMCCPQLGLKGKIDATLQVTIHEKKGKQKSIVPLELKSGKASISAEHRGQLVLYGMMLSLQRGEDPASAVHTGLLLYLKEKVELREVSCGYPERRDLVILRNQLAQYLAAGPEEPDPEQLTDIEDAACLLQQKLPDPIHHERACGNCPYLTLCSLHLWHTDGPSVPESHPLSKLQGQALGHLSPGHIKYFLRWTSLLKMEERGQLAAAPLHSLWTDSVEKREKRGTCAANLKLKSVQQVGDRHLHIFERKTKAIDDLANGLNKGKGPQEGEFSIVSVTNRPWIAAGVVSLSNEKEITILLERDLSRRLTKETVYHIDTYESYATTVQNLTNLGVLMEDSERAERLRNLIIDKEPPQFEPKLSREVGRLGTKLMKSLNIEQQRAVLKGLAAKHYATIQGLPGTGKTQTISVLIQMLVGLKQRVLVTAHTHSAVDTVLSRIPNNIKVMRLGSASRVASCLHERCEQTLVQACDTAEQLSNLYDSMEVVGVTCLGANHSMLAKTTFDICIVDEATQVLQCTVLRPLFAAKRFILVGDPEQLPPVVRSRAARRLGMEDSLFHRLMNEDATATLRLQYRMNQALVEVANKVAYRDRLKCADVNVAKSRLNIDHSRLLTLPEQWLQKACSPEPEDAALFINVETKIAEGKKKGCANVDEACVVLALVDSFVRMGIKPSDIGVIAPYRDQVSLLRRVLSKRGAEGSTVDQFQGRDKDIIIYSCTKHSEGQMNEGEILNDQRRLAVSVTRAKQKLIVIGNSRALKKYVPVTKLIETCKPVAFEMEDLNRVISKYRTEFV